jgi:lysophospholipase L1-like esterase
MRLIPCICWLLLGSTLPVAAQPFRNEIEQFKRRDSLQMPEPGQVLFAGSSSFRLWSDVQSYFPGTPILNRGFGGATLLDLTYYAPQVIRPYKPRMIVIYCGENDFASSDTVQPHHVLQRFKTLYQGIRADYPKTPVYFIAMKPSPSRRHLMDKIAEGNRLIARFLKRKKNAGFIDVYHAMLDARGEPRPELFVEDQLHLNRAGYQLWQKIIQQSIRL